MNDVAFTAIEQSSAVDGGELVEPSVEFLETLSLIERLHRLLLDVLKDEFERLGWIDLNAVQALLLFNIGSEVVTAGDLKELPGLQRLLQPQEAGGERLPQS